MNSDSSLKVFSISPNSGGNLGTVTVTLRGNGFLPGAVVQLIDDKTVIADGIDTVVNSPATITTAFELKPLPEGDLTVVVTNPGGGSAAAPGKFSIVAGKFSELKIHLLAPSIVRGGTPATAYVVVTNEGNQDQEFLTQVKGAESISSPSPTLTAFRAIARAQGASSGNIIKLRSNTNRVDVYRNGALIACAPHSYADCTSSNAVLRLKQTK